MRRLGLALATVAATAAVGTSSASAITINPLDAAKLRVASYNCQALGGKPSTFDLGVECEYIANLNITRQILASAMCGALGWDFFLGKNPGTYFCEVI